MSPRYTVHSYNACNGLHLAIVTDSVPTSATMQRDFRDFHAKLYVNTRIDPLMFSSWLRLHLKDLRIRFHGADEPDSSPAEWTFGIWARQQFLTRKVSV